ncbi:MAG: helix-turn-helix domain-containing protein [Candidatus Omnitrophota bacterium]
MPEEKLLTVREVASFLGISEKEAITLSEDGLLPTYKIAGVYLRFKRQEVEEFRKNSRHIPRRSKTERSASFREMLGDFFYFNDFYIIAGVLIIALFFIILQKY